MLKGLIANMGLKPLINSNHKMKMIGEVIKIDLKKGAASAEILLKGETEPVAASLNYVIDGTILRLSNVKTSKPWLNGMAEAFKKEYSAIDLSRYGKAVDWVKMLV